jgi:urease accessory protein
MDTVEIFSPLRGAYSGGHSAHDHQHHHHDHHHHDHD